MSFLLTSQLCELSGLSRTVSHENKRQPESGGFQGLLEPEHGRVHRNCADLAGVLPAGRGEDVAVRVHIHILLLGASVPGRPAQLRPVLDGSTADRVPDTDTAAGLTPGAAEVRENHSNIINFYISVCVVTLSHQFKIQKKQQQSFNVTLRILKIKVPRTGGNYSSTCTNENEESSSAGLVSFCRFLLPAAQVSFKVMVVFEPKAEPVRACCAL